VNADSGQAGWFSAVTPRLARATALCHQFLLEGLHQSVKLSLQVLRLIGEDGFQPIVPTRNRVGDRCKSGY
jgi:hypothetical protein